MDPLRLTRKYTLQYRGSDGDVPGTRHNEAIFLFHATTLVFFSGFPAWRQMGDALYYANYFADKTFNPFISYPIVAGYFIVMTLVIITIFGLINRRLNRHLPALRRRRIALRLNLIR